MFKDLLEKLLSWVKTLGKEKLSDVDLTAELDDLAKGTRLEWRTSIVDLLKLVGADSSSTARAALGEELGVEGVSGDAAYNEKLRVAVFKKLADNGGNIPQDLL